MSWVFNLTCYIRFSLQIDVALVLGSIYVKFDILHLCQIWYPSPRQDTVIEKKEKRGKQGRIRIKQSEEMLVALMLIERCSQSRIGGTSGTWYMQGLHGQPSNSKWMKSPKWSHFWGEGDEKGGSKQSQLNLKSRLEVQVVHDMLFMKILHFWEGGWGGLVY